MPHPHPRWYDKYSRETPVAWLTFAITQHAVAQRLAAKDACAIIREEQQQELFKFKDVSHDDDALIDGGGTDNSSLDSDASITEHLNSAAARVFQTPKLRPKQEAAIIQILIEPESEGRIFVADRTGGGKSLTLFTTAITVARI